MKGYSTFLDSLLFLLFVSAASLILAKSIFEPLEMEASTQKISEKHASMILLGILNARDENHSRFADIAADLISGEGEGGREKLEEYLNLTSGRYAYSLLISTGSRKILIGEEPPENTYTSSVYITLEEGRAKLTLHLWD
jgi:hypothetical protein